MNMPVGPFVNAGAIICGALLGFAVGGKLPERVHANLPTLFGLLSIGLGVITLPNTAHYAAVSLAAVIGTALGEWLDIEKGLNKATASVRSWADKILPTQGDISAEKFLENYVSLIILFCISGVGFFGSMNEGMTGDASVLYVKAILDGFTAATFAITLEVMVAFIAVPQVLLQLSLFFLATLIVPLTTPEMRADFAAIGGLMLLITGFRIMNIKSFPSANMLPALILVMPFSHIWATYIAH